MIQLNFKTIVTAILLLTLSSVCTAAISEKEISKLVKKLDKAVEKKDVEEIRQFLSDDFIFEFNDFQRINASSQSKENFLTSIADSEDSKIKTIDINFNIDGDSAIVSLTREIRLKSDNKNKTKDKLKNILSERIYLTNQNKKLIISKIEIVENDEKGWTHDL